MRERWRRADGDARWPALERGPRARRWSPPWAFGTGQTSTVPTSYMLGPEVHASVTCVGFTNDPHSLICRKAMRLVVIHPGMQHVFPTRPSNDKIARRRARHHPSNAGCVLRDGHDRRFCLTAECPSSILLLVVSQRAIARPDLDKIDRRGSSRRSYRRCVRMLHPLPKNVYSSRLVSTLAFTTA